MTYEYRMVQVNLEVSPGARTTGTEVPLALQELANREAVEGWEYYRADPLSLPVPGGCLGIGGAETRQFLVVTFRRRRGEE